MKKLRIGIPAQQVDLNPTLATELAMTLNQLVLDLRKAFYWTDPNDARVQSSLSYLFTYSAKARRDHLFQESSKPVAINDTLNATLIIHSYVKKALNICTLGLIAIQRLELNRDVSSTHYIAQQLDQLRELIDTSDKPTLESAISLLADNIPKGILDSDMLNTLAGIANLLERLRKLVNDQSYS